MKKTIVLLFFVLFILLSSLSSQVVKIKVTTETAKIYRNQTVNSPIIETVEKGTILNLLFTKKIRNIWYYVSFYSKKRSTVVFGFIKASLVEIMAGKPEIKKKGKKQAVTPVSTLKTYAPKITQIGLKSCVGFLPGYVIPLEDNYSGGFQYGGNICMGITKNISIELCGLRFRSDVEGAPEALSKGKLSVIPIQLNVHFQFPISGRFVPYLVGGGGYYLNRFNLDKEIIDAWDALGFDIEEKVENAIGYHLGAGINFFFTKNIALNADFRYCIANTKGSWVLTDQILGEETSGDLEDLNLNSFKLGTGLKFYF